MDCIFCKIINGEIPSYTLYEDDVVKVFLDVNPDVNGHALVVPKKHYQDLEYKIKDEKIDGDKATVTTEVTVRDYSKVLGDADTYKETNAKEFNDETGNYSAGLFSKYRLTKLKDVTEKKTYTLEITLTKKDGEWIMDELSETDEQKINGLYNDGTNIGSNINESDDNKLNDNLDTDKDNEENQNDNPLMNDQRDSDDTKNEADDNSILE